MTDFIRIDTLRRNPRGKGGCAVVKRHAGGWLWLVAALSLVAAPRPACAQDEELLPSILPGTTGVEAGMTSLGRTPGAGGPLIENAPGAGDALLGGRPGPAFP